MIRKSEFCLLEIYHPKDKKNFLKTWKFPYLLGKSNFKKDFTFFLIYKFGVLEVKVINMNQVQNL